MRAPIPRAREPWIRPGLANERIARQFDDGAFRDPALKNWILLLLVSAAMAGCANPGEVTEHPVDTPAPPLKPGVYPVTAVDVAPVSTHEVEPDYPPELGGILVGKAVVVFTVRTDGKVTDEAVVKADDTLFRGIRPWAQWVKWRFHPAQLHGAPVDCRMTQTFVFNSSPLRLYPGRRLGAQSIIAAAAERLPANVSHSALTLGGAAQSTIGPGGRVARRGGIGRAGPGGEMKGDGRQEHITDYPASGVSRGVCQIPTGDSFMVPSA